MNAHKLLLDNVDNMLLAAGFIRSGEGWKMPRHWPLELKQHIRTKIGGGANPTWYRRTAMTLYIAYLETLSEP